jgi:hypothetical protein
LRKNEAAFKVKSLSGPCLSLISDESEDCKVRPDVDCVELKENKFADYEIFDVNN